MSGIFNYDWFTGPGFEQQKEQARHRCARKKFPDLTPEQRADHADSQQFSGELEVRTLIYLRDGFSYEIKQIAEKERLQELYRDAQDAVAAFREPIQFGFIRGVEDFIDQALDMFTKFREIVSSAFTSLAGVISQSITGALTGEGSNFRENFRQFLANIANQIISMLVQVAIAKALLRLGFLGGDQVPNFGDLLSRALGGGLAKGGPVKARKSLLTAHAPFARARGAFSGVPVLGRSGNVPSSVSSATRDIVALKPKSVDPRDKVPIWASPGEWVLRAKAVKLYGSDIMGMLNTMMIDPTALRAIAGITGRGRAVRRVSGGAATGGGITSTSGAPTAQAGSQEPSGPVTAIVAGTEESMQQMLQGGGNALLDFLRENRDEYMGEERGRAQ